MSFSGALGTAEESHVLESLKPFHCRRPDHRRDGRCRDAGPRSILFVERALPNNLVPNRDVGVQVHGELGRGVFGCQAGVFNGVPDGGSVDTDTNDSKELAGRVFIAPWKAHYTSPLRGLGVGFAATSGKASGTLRGYSSVSQVGVFSYLSTVTANGDRKRISPQGYFYSGPFGLPWASTGSGTPT